MPMIPMHECKNGKIYKLSSRNLSFGVYVKDRQGFIGIRTKFGHRFLFMEHHYDQGPPYGTAHALEEIGGVPEGIELKETNVTLDHTTRLPVEFVQGQGWRFVNGELSKNIDPVSTENKELYQCLEVYL